MIVVSVNFHTEAEMDRMALYEENMTLDAGAQKIKEAYMNIETLISTQETLQVRETIHNNSKGIQIIFTHVVPVVSHPQCRRKD